MSGLIMALLFLMTKFSFGAATAITYNGLSALLPWENYTSEVSYSSSSHSCCLELHTMTTSINQPMSSTQAVATLAINPLPQRYYVSVGAAGMLLFEPNTVIANIGDIIQFDFLSLNHTLTQSSLWQPCNESGGFDTGFNQFNPKNTTGKYIIEYQIDTLTPQWFFCAQTIKRSHCEAGMVFAINAGDQMTEFIASASNMSQRSNNITITTKAVITETMTTLAMITGATMLETINSGGASSTLVLEAPTIAVPTPSPSNSTQVQNTTILSASPTISGAGLLEVSIAFAILPIILPEVAKIIFDIL